VHQYTPSLGEKRAASPARFSAEGHEDGRHRASFDATVTGRRVKDGLRIGSPPPLHGAVVQPTSLSGGRERRGLEEDTSHDGDVVVFALEGRSYGIPADSVVELHQMVATVPLPGAPPIVEGVINVRGSVVPVLDLRSRLDLPGRPAEPQDHLVLVLVDGAVVGLRVDRVEELIRVPEIERSFNAVAPRIHSLVTLDDGLLLIPDIASLLFPDEATALREALRSIVEEDPEDA
jgi:purine-binding chemotaxis protein CheW